MFAMFGERPAADDGGSVGVPWTAFADNGVEVRKVDPLRTAATYGYRNLVFTPELGEELIRLTALGTDDYIASYVGLDELTRSMGPEAVKAALEFLRERGMLETEELGAPGHLSFRLGMLLGEEGVAFARSLGADVENTILGWCQTDPTAGLSWLHEFLGASEDNALNLDEDAYWKWAIESHPEACLELYIEQLQSGIGDRGWGIANEIAAIGTRLGRWDLLETHVETLVGTADNFRWNLASALADHRAEADPWGTLAAASGDLPEQWRMALQRSAFEVLAEREPVELLDHLMAESRENGSIAGTIGGSMMELAMQLPEEALIEALTSTDLPSSMRGPMTVGFLQSVSERGGTRALLDTVEQLEMPSVMRKKLTAGLAMFWLDQDPEAARAQLYAAYEIDPEVAAMVRAGRPNWEIRLMLEDAVQNNETMSEEDMKELHTFFGGGF